MATDYPDEAETGSNERPFTNRKRFNDISARYRDDDDLRVGQRDSIERRSNSQSLDFEQSRTNQNRMSNLDPSSTESNEDQSHGFSVSKRSVPPTYADTNGHSGQRRPPTNSYDTNRVINDGGRTPTTVRQSIPIELGGSSSNRRTCVLDINITLSVGGRSGNQITTVSNDRISRGLPSATTITLDDVHTIDFDLEVPRNTVQIVSDGTKRDEPPQR